jgi:hypothetical protein
VSKSLPRCRVEHFLSPVSPAGPLGRRAVAARATTLDAASAGLNAVGATSTLVLGAERAAGSSDTTGVLASRRLEETCAVVAEVPTRAEVAATGNAIALASTTIERFNEFLPFPPVRVAKGGPVPGKAQETTQ